MALHDLNASGGNHAAADFESALALSKQDDLANMVRAFLTALDRGYLGWDGMAGPSYDRREMAHVTGLREAIALHEGRS